MKYQQAFIKVCKGTYVTSDKRFMIQHNNQWQIYHHVYEEKYEMLFGYASTLTIAKDYILREWYNTTLLATRYLNTLPIQYNGKPVHPVETLKIRFN